MTRTPRDARPSYALLRAAAIALALTLFASAAVAQSGMPPGHGMPSGGPKDTSSADPALPAGVVHVALRDASGSPLPSRQVSLIIRRDTVAEGKSETTRRAVTSSGGEVEFSELATESGYSYVVAVDAGAAPKESRPFTLRGSQGQRITLHVYPTTTDLAATSVAGRAILYAEPREDLFQFDLLLELFNLGQVTWIAQDVPITLPAGWKGFSPQQSDDSLQAIEQNGTVYLQGAVDPGQHSVIFRFQVPRENTAVAAMAIGLPPHMSDVRVMVESGPRMSLVVDGFPAAIPSKNQSGEPLLATRRQISSATEGDLSQVTIRVAGLPLQGSGRWLALWLAIGTATTGVWYAFRGGGRADHKLVDTDARRARELLYEELMAVEASFERGEIGPATRQRARGALLDAVVRLDLAAGDAAPKA